MTGAGDTVAEVVRISSDTFGPVGKPSEFTANALHSTRTHTNIISVPTHTYDRIYYIPLLFRTHSCTTYVCVCVSVRARVHEYVCTRVCVYVLQVLPLRRFYDLNLPPTILPIRCRLSSAILSTAVPSEFSP